MTAEKDARVAEWLEDYIAMLREKRMSYDSELADEVQTYLDRFAKSPAKHVTFSDANGKHVLTAEIFRGNAVIVDAEDLMKYLEMTMSQEIEPMRANL